MVKDGILVGNASKVICEHSIIGLVARSVNILFREGIGFQVE